MYASANRDVAPTHVTCHALAVNSFTDAIKLEVTAARLIKLDACLVPEIIFGAQFVVAESAFSHVMQVLSTIIKHALPCRHVPQGVHQLRVRKLHCWHPGACCKTHANSQVNVFGLSARAIKHDSQCHQGGLKRTNRHC